eukprot:2482729-Alexandrium_andersonii.AAC.1
MELAVQSTSKYRELALHATPRKRLRRAHRPASSADSASAREAAKSASLQTFRSRVRGWSWACEVQASKAGNRFACSEVA